MRSFAEMVVGSPHRLGDCSDNHSKMLGCPYSNAKAVHLIA